MDESLFFFLEGGQRQLRPDDKDESPYSQL